jgi:CCR4-NOT transcription complex subunit 1
MALTLHQATQTDGEVKPERVHFLESILSLVILYQCDHYKVRGDTANSKFFFRLYSSLLFEIAHVTSPYIPQEDMYLAMARAFMAVQPNYLPGFVFSWLALISHRVFMPAMLRMASDQVISLEWSQYQALTDQAFDRYLDLLQVMFETVGRLVAPSLLAGNSDLIAQAQQFHRGVLRTMVVLQHDFPDFLVENHTRICNGIPDVCIQLKNLVLSATPSDSQELPSPFNTNFKLDMVEVDPTSPLTRGDMATVLSDAKLLPLVDDVLRTIQASPEDVSKLGTAVNKAVSTQKGPPEPHRVAVINALVVHIVVTATAPGEASFDKPAACAALLRQLARELEGEARHDFVNGLMNQLRFPNKHTLFVLDVVIGMFAAQPADEADEIVFEIVTCVLIERLAVQRPHPWGVMVALLEIHKQHSHVFWELPFIKGSVEVRLAVVALLDPANVLGRTALCVLEHAHQCPQTDGIGHDDFSHDRRRYDGRLFDSVHQKSGVLGMVSCSAWC